MPQLRVPSHTLNSSDSVCLKIGDLSLDSDDAGSEIYFKLGLKQRSKGSLKAPRCLALLSSLLEASILKNELLVDSEQLKDDLTVFHGSRAPPVSIRQYIDRIFKYAGCSPSCFIVAYIYVDRYLQQTEAYLTSLNVHRLLITSLMVAAKFIDDAFFSNAYYAKVGGVSISEMNRLEMKLLFSIDFRLQVSVETFKNYCLQLEKEGGGCENDRAIKSCRVKKSWSSKGDPRTVLPLQDDHLDHYKSSGL